MPSTLQRQREGQCDRCRNCWLLSLNLPIRAQICPTCNGPLKPVSRAQTQADGVVLEGAGVVGHVDGRVVWYVWLTWESYQQQ